MTDAALNFLPEDSNARDIWDTLVADEDFDLAGFLASSLMKMPAPDAAALRWKLDYLLTDRDDEFADQTVLDYRRLLGEA